MHEWPAATELRAKRGLAGRDYGRYMLLSSADGVSRTTKVHAMQPKPYGVHQPYEQRRSPSRRRMSCGSLNSFQQHFVRRYETKKQDFETSTAEVTEDKGVARIYLCLEPWPRSSSTLLSACQSWVRRLKPSCGVSRLQQLHLQTILFLHTQQSLQPQAASGALPKALLAQRIAPSAVKHTSRQLRKVVVRTTEPFVLLHQCSRARTFFATAQQAQLQGLCRTLVASVRLAHRFRCS